MSCNFMNPVKSGLEWPSREDYEVPGKELAKTREFGKT